MTARTGGWIARYLPPALVGFCSRLRKKRGFYGNYQSWAAARRDSSGYDAGRILDKVSEALLQVKQGTAVYERDSVLFDAVQHAWPLLTALLWIASRHGNRLNVMDFGGSLGSSYFQCRGFLGHLALDWSIVEQAGFVARGRELFQDEVLRFYPSPAECFADRQPDTLLLSSVLPYLEQPYQALRELLELTPNYVIIDRTPLRQDGKDRLTVQIVPEEIYGGSYPAWFLSEARLLGVMEQDYDLIAEFDALSGEIDLGDEVVRDRGFIFARRVPATAPAPPLQPGGRGAGPG